MDPSAAGARDVFVRSTRGAWGAPLLALALACAENVSGSVGCPQLCADQSATLRDTVLTGAVVLDTTVAGFPRIGESRDVALLSQGDTADVRAVIRFDSLPSTYRAAGATADSAIRRVDSAAVLFVVDTGGARPAAPLTISAFDVDTTAADTATGALLPLFRADRQIGSRTFAVTEVKDTLRLPLSGAAVLDKITRGQRLRVGLRASGAQSVRLRVVGSSFLPRLRFRVSADTAVRPDTVLPRSLTPAGDATLASTFVLYQVVARGALPPPAGSRLAVGGLAGARVYMRFDIPSVVLDSVQIVRASLLLQQLPSRVPAAAGDTVTLYTLPVVSSPVISDVTTVMQFLFAGPALFVDSLRLAARDSGVRSIELVNVVRAWRAVGTTNTSRAIVLRASREGTMAAELGFSSLEGAPSSRPRLRLLYVPRRGFGIP